MNTEISRDSKSTSGAHFKGGEFGLFDFDKFRRHLESTDTQGEIQLTFFCLRGGEYECDDTDALPVLIESRAPCTGGEMYSFKENHLLVALGELGRRSDIIPLDTLAARSERTFTNETIHSAMIFLYDSLYELFNNHTIRFNKHEEMDNILYGFIKGAFSCLYKDIDAFHHPGIFNIRMKYLKLGHFAVESAFVSCFATYMSDMPKNILTPEVLIAQSKKCFKGIEAERMELTLDACLTMGMGAYVDEFKGETGLISFIMAKYPVEFKEGFLKVFKWITKL